MPHLLHLLTFPDISCNFWNAVCLSCWTEDTCAFVVTGCLASMNPRGACGKLGGFRRLVRPGGIFSRGVSFLPTCGKLNSFRYKDLALAHGVPFISARGEDEPRIPFRGLRAGPARSSPVCFRRSPQTHPNGYNIIGGGAYRLYSHLPVGASPKKPLSYRVSLSFL